MTRTRFVCVSDTHGYTPQHGAFKLPKGDVLIHAGDLSNQGSLSELQRTIGWIENSDYEVKIVVAGNHDITLDRDFYAQHGHRFHNQGPENLEKCIGLLSNSSIIYLNHQSVPVSLTKPEGPKTRFKVFGSPFSPGTPGKWAFTYSQENNDAYDLWDGIPLDTDVLVTHTPPLHHCDVNASGIASGCKALRQALWRVRPQLAVCGHIHQNWGSERIRWDLTCSDSTYGESENKHEAPPRPPPGSKRQYLVDLTGKKGPKLCHDGSDLAINPQPHLQSERPLEEGSMSTAESPSTGDSSTPIQLCDHAETTPDARVTQTQGRDRRRRGGQGDTEALSGRLGRKETCIVNASIMANSWPHRGGKRFNAPIVVDLDLPV